MVLSSCIEEPENPKVKLSENAQIMNIKSWFEANEIKLRLPDKGANFRTKSQELVLPYFEKEPNWDEFQHYRFSDGREVFEISLENGTKYFPKQLLDSLPDLDIEDVMVQNIMFIKNPTEDRFDPLIARYFPYDEFSAGKQKEISFNNLHQFWSGRIDIFTYDEHHFIGFEINEGEITNRVVYGNSSDSNARIASDCTEIEREVVWTTGSPGPADEDPLGLGVEFHSIMITETFCTGGSDGNNGGYPPNTVFEGGRPYYQYADNIGGTCSNCEYKIPIVTEPENSIILQIQGHPCATDIMKKMMKASVIKSSIGELNQMNEIIQLLNDAADFDFVIKSADIIDNEKPPFIQPNAETMSRAIFNLSTGKKEIHITFLNGYLESATQLSIARTFLHESIHAYLVYLGYVEPQGSIRSALLNYASTHNLYDNQNTVQHVFMSQYINAIGYSLAEWHRRFNGVGTIPRSYFDEIAWGGLTQVLNEDNQISWYPSFANSITSESKRQDIQSKINNEQTNNTSAKSDNC